MEAELKEVLGSILQELGSLRGDVGTLTVNMGVLTSDVATLKSDVKRLDEKSDALRREFGVISEDLRREIRLVAEAVALQGEKSVTLEAKVDDGLDDHEQRITRLEAERLRRM